MKFEIQLLSFSVYLNGKMSIKLKANEGGLSGDIRDGLREIKDITKRITINEMSVFGVVKSINFSSGENLLLHVQIDKYAVNRLSELLRYSGGQNITVTVTILSDLEESINRMLNKLSSLRNKEKESLLYELSSFINNKGDQIDGINSIYQVNRKRQIVIESKLKEALLWYPIDKCKGPAVNA